MLDILKLAGITMKVAIMFVVVVSRCQHHTSDHGKVAGIVAVDWQDLQLKLGTGQQVVTARGPPGQGAPCRCGCSGWCRRPPRMPRWAGRPAPPPPPSCSGGLRPRPVSDRCCHAFCPPQGRSWLRACQGSDYMRHEPKDVDVDNALSENAAQFEITEHEKH